MFRLFLILKLYDNAQLLTYHYMCYNIMYRNKTEIEIPKFKI